MRWNTIRRWCKSLIQDSPSGSLFTFGQLSCFFPHLTGPWTLPKMHARLFSKMDPTPEACGCMSTLIMGWGGSPFLFWPSRRLLAHAQTGKSSLTSGVGTLSLCFSRAQLLPLALSLECLGENKASVLLHLTNTTCLARGPICLLPRVLRRLFASFVTMSPWVIRWKESTCYWRASLYAWCSEATQAKTSEFEARKGLLKCHMRIKGGLCPSNLGLPKGLQQSTFKGKMREGLGWLLQTSWST